MKEIETMFFSQNIKLLRKRKGRTQDDVAFALKMKRPTLSGYENEVAKPGVEVLVAFADYYGVTIDTLIRVDLNSLSESMLSQLERGMEVYVKGGKLRVLATTVNADNKENIELVQERAKAGYTRGFADPDFIEKLPVFQLPFLPENKKFRTFQLNGDSMLPIPDGAWVIGEYVVDWSTLTNGQACIVCTLDDGLVFKVVENNIEESGELLLHSLNPEYKPYTVPVNQITELWKFTHYISHQMPEGGATQEELLRRIKNIQNDLDGIKNSLAM